MENLKYLTEFIWSIVGLSIIVFFLRNQRPLRYFISASPEQSLP